MGSLLTVAFAVLLYLILDYPFSLLYFRGVKVVSSPKKERKGLGVKNKNRN